MYPLAGVRGAEVDGEPLRAAYIHRLPAKISSIAWNPFDEVCPALMGPCRKKAALDALFMHLQLYYCCLLLAAGSHCLPAKASFLPAILIKSQGTVAVSGQRWKVTQRPIFIICAAAGPVSS